MYSKCSEKRYLCKIKLFYQTTKVYHLALKMEIMHIWVGFEVDADENFGFYVVILQN
jgi:hypothetical protein